MNLAAYRKLIASRRYLRLSAALSGENLGNLAGLWPGLKPVEKLVLFKLMESKPAMELYRALPFEEKYFLLLGHPAGSVAPAIEGLAPAVRRLFAEKPEGFYDRMLTFLVGDEVGIPLTYDRN